MTTDQIERAVLLIFELGGLIVIYLRIRLAEKNICDRKDCPLKRDGLLKQPASTRRRRRRRTRPGRGTGNAI